MPLITDKFGKASIGTDVAVATTVKTARLANVAVLEAYDLSKYAQDTPVFVVTYAKSVDPVTGITSIVGLKSWKALVNPGANTLTNLTIQPGYTDNGNAAGEFIECIPTSAWENSLIDGILTSLNPDGTLKTSAVQQALNISGAVPADYVALATNPSACVYLGARQYQLTYPGVDYTDRLQKKTRLRATRNTLAPNMSTLLNGVNRYWSVASPTKFTFTNTFTLMTFVKGLNTYPVSAGSILSRDSPTSAGSGWEINVTNQGQLNIFWRNGSGTSVFNSRDFCVPLGRDFHLAVAVTAATNTVNIYIDGIQVATDVVGTAGTTIVQPTGGNMYVGNRAGTGTGFLNAMIAQMAVFSVALTQAQILNYISQGFQGNEANLISAWSFSGNANDLNTTTPNNLTSNGGATALNPDAPFGVQGNETFSTSIEYGIIAQVTKPAADTIVLVTVPEGGALPTIGSMTTSYSTAATPFGFPGNKRRWEFFFIQNTVWQPSANAVMQQTNIAMTLPIGDFAIRAKWDYDAEVPSGGSISEHLMGIGTAPGGAAYATTNLEGSLYTLYDSSNVSSHRLMQAIAVPPINVSLTAQTRYWVLCTKNAGISVMLRSMVAPAFIAAENTLL